MFSKALDIVLRWEGGYHNDPSDPGGETNWGISKKSYPTLDIKNLTRDGAAYIYEMDYWNKAGCDKLPGPLALVTFNAAVNTGLGRALRWLDACGGDYREFIRLQLAHYAGTKNRLYLLGWLNRTLAVWNEANTWT